MHSGPERTTNATTRAAAAGGPAPVRAWPVQSARVATPEELAACCRTAEIGAIATGPPDHPHGIVAGTDLPSGGRFEFQRVAFDVAVRTGVETFVLLLPLDDPDWGRVNGWPLRDRAARRAFAPGGEVFATVPASSGLGVVKLDWAALERTADDLGSELPSLGPDMAVADEGSLLTELTRALASRLGPGWSEADAAAADSELREAVVRALAGPEPIHNGSRRSFSMVADADSYAAATGWRNVSISEVCRAIGTSESQLRRAFRDVVDCSPKRYFTVQALNAAHAALRAAHPRDTTVTETATALGFWHLGRFAGDYRDLFGELPVETLRAAAAM